MTLSFNLYFFRILDHSELDAQIPASYSYRQEEGIHFRFRYPDVGRGGVPDIRISGERVYRGHRIPEPTGECEETLAPYLTLLFSLSRSRNLKLTAIHLPKDLEIRPASRSSRGLYLYAL